MTDAGIVLHAERQGAKRMTIKTLLIEFFFYTAILFTGYWIATALCYLIKFMFGF